MLGVGTLIRGQDEARPDNFQALPMPSLEYTDEVAAATAHLYERVKSVIPAIEWPVMAPTIKAINDLKKVRNAVILAHNYQTPEIYHCVADIVGDSLQLAVAAAKSDADVIVQCGVHFMAETSKLLNPDKRVLIPDTRAGCSLAASITGSDVRRLREGRLASDDALVTLCLAPRGNQFATMEVTKQDWQLAKELGLRISCHAGDGEWGRNRPVAQLQAAGLLGPTMTFVHCNTLADDELAMMAAAGSSASISPDIELQMGHGWPATGRLLEAGIRPSLSIDVCSSNGGHLFGTMRATIGTERGFDNEQARERGEASVAAMELTCRDVLEFATIEGARACGLEAKVGSLTPGKRADVIVVRADSFGMTPMNNPIGAFVYNAHPGLVDTILVDGIVVKRGGALLGVDRARVRRAAIESRDDIIARAGGAAGARTGGDWIPEAYVAQA